MFVLSSRKGRRGIFENLGIVFRQTGGGQRAFPVSASSQLPSAQSNTYAKVAYFGAALLLSLTFFVTAKSRTYWFTIAKVGSTCFYRTRYRSLVHRSS